MCAPTASGLDAALQKARGSSEQRSLNTNAITGLPLLFFLLPVADYLLFIAEIADPRSLREVAEERR